MTLAEEIGRFLAAHHVLTLATLDEGGPWAAPLFYVNDAALDLFFLSDPAARHCRALTRDPRVSAAIHGDATAWSGLTGLQLHGWAQPLDAPDDRVAERYAAKFPFARVLVPPDAPHGFYRIRPRWLRLIDNARGFGYKAQLDLEARRP